MEPRLNGTAPEAAQRQASAGARDGVKGRRNDHAARAPLHGLVRRRRDNIGLLDDNHSGPSRHYQCLGIHRLFVVDEKRVGGAALKARERSIAIR